MDLIWSKLTLGLSLLPPSFLPFLLHVALCGSLSLSLFIPLSLHHHSLPPSGVTAHWLQVVREEGRKGCREGWIEEELKAGGGVSVICSCAHTITMRTGILLSADCLIIIIFPIYHSNVSKLTLWSITKCETLVLHTLAFVYIFSIIFYL